MKQGVFLSSVWSHFWRNHTPERPDKWKNGREMRARSLPILPLCDFLMPFWHFEASVITISDNQPSVGEQIFIWALEGTDNKVALFPSLQTIWWMFCCANLAGRFCWSWVAQFSLLCRLNCDKKTPGRYIFTKKNISKVSSEQSVLFLHSFIFSSASALLHPPPTSGGYGPPSAQAKLLSAGLVPFPSGPHLQRNVSRG